MLSVKQGGIKNHFLSLWYVSTWDWTLVSQTIVALKRNIIFENGDEKKSQKNRLLKKHVHTKADSWGTH